MPTAPMPGASDSYSISTRKRNRPSSLASRPITSRPPASFGATPSTTGRRWPRTITPGGSALPRQPRPLRLHPHRSLPRRSIITGKLPAMLRRRRKALGGWATRALFRCRDRCFGELPLIAEDLGEPEIARLRITRPLRFPRHESAAIRLGHRRRRSFLAPQLHPRIVSFTPAPTTTTPPAAGTKKRPNRNGIICAVICVSVVTMSPGI